MPNMVSIVGGLGGGVIAGAIAYFIADNLLSALGQNEGMWATVLLFIPIAVLALVAAVIIRIFG